MVRACVQLSDEIFCWDVVPAWERSFGIRFASTDFAHATTVGEIWAVVEQHLISRVWPNPSGLGVSCATQRTFYQLRRALMEQGVARAEILPSSQLRVLFPWRNRRRMWKYLQQNLGVPLPGLRVPASYFATLWGISAALFLALVPGWESAVVCGFSVALTASQSQWMRWELPGTTLGELIDALVATNYKALSHPYVRHNLGEMRDIVLAGLARCGIEATEVDPDELRDGTRLTW